MSETFGQDKAKKGKYSATNGTQPEVAIKSVVQDNRKRFVRRENVRKKVFMSQITDILATGNLSGNGKLGIMGKRVEISKVQISPDFKSLYIFWTTNNERESDNEIQELLNSFVVPIRECFYALRIVGHVPKICFVKDKVRSKLADIEILLSKADYGKDFNPMYPTLLNTGHMKLSNRTFIEKWTLEDPNEMPLMRNDILRIDHTDIMQSIYKVVQKSNALHRKTEAGVPLVLGYGEIPPLKEFQSSRAPPESYSEFVRSQKIISSKLRKEKLSKLREQEKELSDKFDRMREGTEEITFKFWISEKR
ncbi:hypothetical protein WDU94_000699 [Cyamophila willieti]